MKAQAPPLHGKPGTTKSQNAHAAAQQANRADASALRASAPLIGALDATPMLRRLEKQKVKLTARLQATAAVMMIVVLLSALLDVIIESSHLLNLYLSSWVANAALFALSWVLGSLLINHFNVDTEKGPSYWTLYVVAYGWALILIFAIGSALLKTR